MIEYLDDFYARVRSGELVFADCSEHITRNIDCCLEAIKYNSSNFYFVDKGFKQNDGFIISALKVNPHVADELDTETLSRVLKKVIVRLNNAEKDVDRYKKIDEVRTERDREETRRGFSKIVDEYGYDNPKEF